ncbi:BON domain-containing protein [Thalassoglobus polymorphus]|uniref:BON domain protein n=1 Tax=Thalassoglobus polymorphus TaxID=2527994 RepID=A0A517QJR5_9PLAN|nr:BON domain-containing protein [Thalassoglobus polymorphus]QDT31845.1 hypothetical protein Mal48_10810 [Thalassoglobus polymorphus]
MAVLNLLNSPDKVRQPTKLNSAGQQICKSANAILNRQYVLGIQRLECLWENGKLTITGRVPLYYHKQLAQQLIMDANIGGIKLLVNEIEVC